ncbi:MAG: FecR domain-containing protein [Planctomycetaceae bacterium]|nr:FecR domain-containing protein [Planctomycetaceae bacterium]
MNSAQEQLIEQWLDGSIDSAGETALSEWLSEHPEAMQRFVEENIRDQMLREAVRTEAVSSRVHEATSTPITMKRFSGRRVIASFAALAACLLFGLMWFRNPASDDPPSETFFTVAMIQNADLTWSVGDRLGPVTINLADGLMRLLFDDGVEVTLQGPARYQLIAPGRTRLHAGLLTATVPPGAEGFQVDTPTAEVVDLGTAFGIALDTDGQTVVSVFDGEVEVKSSNSEDRQLVREGEAVRVDSTQVRTSEFDANTYVKIWPASSGIVESTGAFLIAPPWPRRMGLVQSDSEIFVLPEGYAKELDEPLTLNITLPGDYRLESQLVADQLPAESRVRSFLLQFRPVDSGEREPDDVPLRADASELKRIVGDVTFDRPILGLIVRGDDLRASDGLFSIRGGQVPQKGRALELFGTPRDDRVTLSDDRRTVRLDLAAFGLFSDQVRVIVDQSLTKQGVDHETH